MRLGTLIGVAGAVGVVAWMGGGCSSSTNSGTGTPDSGADSGGPVVDGGAEGGTDAAPAGNCNPPCAGAHVACDPADNKCKPDGTTTAIGAKCMTSGADPVCGSAMNATCNDETADGFPGGYCSFEPCTTTVFCPLGATCAHLGGESDACWKNCSSDADCRTPDYQCINVDPLVTSGASKKVCFLKDLACTKNLDCPTVKPTCTFPDAGGGDAGAPAGTCK